ncbi:hypothetical protein Ancab_009238 [Ancistrocladus abbreviatus]
MAENRRNQPRMADLKAEEWLPAGWKVEIRVRKTGKKDRYYVDPASGNLFRSIKDIHRYLLTGKLGGRVTKSKQSSTGSNDVKLDNNKAPLKKGASKKEKSQSHVVAQTRKSSVKGKQKEVSGCEDLKEKAKIRKIARSAQKEESMPFFIDDSDQCGEGATLGLLNLPEIIESMPKEEGSHGTVYVSAPAIGALLGRPLVENGAKQQIEDTSWKWLPRKPMPLLAREEPIGDYQKPKQEAGVPGGIFHESPCLADDYAARAEVIDAFKASQVLLASEDRNPSNAMDDQTGMVNMESTSADNPGWPVALPFRDLCSDPCIDFAIKTLTGAIDPALEDYLQAHLCSSRSQVDIGLKVEGSLVEQPGTEREHAVSESD